MTTHSSIPTFKTLEEEAALWDMHDPADLQGELRTVRAHFAKNLSAGLNIRLDPHSLEQLRSVARKKGIGPTTQARIWIMEHLSAAR